MGHAWVKTLTWFLGEAARPIAIISASFSASFATVSIALSGKDFSGAAMFIGAVFAGLGAIYTAKAWENNTVVKADADVKKSEGATDAADVQLKAAAKQNVAANKQLDAAELK